MMDAIPTRREDHAASLVDESHNRLLRRRIQHDVCQGHRMPRWVADKIDGQGVPYDTASTIGSDGVTRSNAPWRFAVSAPDDNAFRILLHRFHGVPAPDVHAQFACALFDEPFGCRLWQEERERKTRIQHREVKQGFQST